MLFFSLTSNALLSQQYNADSILAISKLSKNDSVKVQKYHEAVSLYLNENDLFKADSLVELMLKICEGQGNQRGNMLYFNDKGYLFNFKAIILNRLKYYLKSLKLAEEKKQVNFISSVYNNLGIIFYNQ